MTHRAWETIKVCYCQHAHQDVGLQVELVYPAEWLPEQPARVLARRCSQGMACNLVDRPSCIWAGTNPVFDPFLEP